MVNLNLIELDLNESININGGLILLPKWFKGGVLGIAAGLVIDNWANIKSGLIDGFEDGLN